jgi:hypothetical protein
MLFIVFIGEMSIAKTCKENTILISVYFNLNLMTSMTLILRLMKEPSKGKPLVWKIFLSPVSIRLGEVLN